MSLHGLCQSEGPRGETICMLPLGHGGPCGWEKLAALSPMTDQSPETFSAQQFEEAAKSLEWLSRDDNIGKIGAHPDTLRKWARMLRQQAEAIAALRERLTKWERAADEFMVTNWIGVYDRDDEPKRTFEYCVEHALDQERDALRAQVETLTRERDEARQYAPAESVTGEERSQ